MNDDTYYHGTTRIRNPKTLQKWISKGWYQECINRGLTFNVGCGRFRDKPCTCSKCRHSTNSPLKQIILKYTVHG